MIKTPDLIEALVADARAVRRLRPPALRAARWLLLPAMIFGLLIVAQGVRPDFGLQFHQPDFVLGLAASLATGVLAAVASFMLDLPDRPRGWALLPVPTLILWVVSTGINFALGMVMGAAKGDSTAATPRKVLRYGKTGPGPPGSAMTVEFRLEGQTFVALNA